jgi:hypothetical protein
MIAIFGSATAPWPTLRDGCMTEDCCDERNDQSYRSSHLVTVTKASRATEQKKIKRTVIQDNDV